MITLGQRLAFQEQYGDHLDVRLKEIAEMKEGFEKDLCSLEHGYDSAYKAYSFLHNISLAEAQQIPINTAGSTVMPFLIPEAAAELNNAYGFLPAIELAPSSKITFNQFLVAKEYIRQLTAMGKGRWNALPFLCAIYLLKEGEDFIEKDIAEGSKRLNHMMELPIEVALYVGEWFDKHNQYLFDNFSVFQASRAKGINMEELFDRWGWISFLSMIAKEGVFTIPGNGLNAIENAKISPLYDILVYASEKKDSDDIVNFYYEQLNKK